MMLITIPGLSKRNVRHDVLMFMVGIEVHSRDVKDGIEVNFDTNKLDYELDMNPFELKIWVKGSRRYLYAKINRVTGLPWLTIEMFD